MRNHGDNLHVYVIALAKCGPCKIGISTSPNKRLASLQTAHYETLEIHSLWASDKLNPRQVERRVHTILRYARLRGEWFSVSVSQAEEVLRKLDDGKPFDLSDDLVKTLERAMRCHPRYRLGAAVPADQEI